MTEEELMQIGFFKIDTDLPGMKRAIARLKLFEYYKGVFVRIIASRYDNDFIVDHIYFDSPESDKLQLELFGTDLSVENIIHRIKIYREESKLLGDIPETF